MYSEQPKASEPVVSLRDVMKSYGSQTAIDNISFSVSNGSVLTLVGHNGAGKSTTLKIVAGLLTPDSGEVSRRLRGDDLQSEIGYLPEQPDLDPEMTGREYLVLFGRLHGMNKEEALSRADEYSSYFNMTSLSQKIGTMSKGMVQKVALIQTVLHDPAILLYDEPTSGLDPQTRDEVLEFISRQADGNKSVIVSSHDVAGFEQVSSEFLILSDGTVKERVTEEDSSLVDYTVRFVSQTEVITKNISTQQQLNSTVEEIITGKDTQLIEVRRDFSNALSNTEVNTNVSK